MSQQPQAPAPSIPSSLAPGKDPPVLQPGAVVESVGDGDGDREGEGEGETKRGATGEEGDADVNLDARAMPPPPLPQAHSNPRRTSYRPDSNDGLPPQSPGIILTQPTFEFPSKLANKQTQSQSQSQSQEGAAKEGNTQQSLLGEGLAGTEGTVKGLGIGVETGSGIQRPNFAPFFTLVNDGSASGKTFHPQRVHYIFADDEETGVLTEALVRCVDAGELPEGKGADGGAGPGKKEKGARAGEREERVVIVDINDTGDGIKGVWSANPNWAVLNAEIGNAPTWDGTEGEEEKEGGIGGMMLRIEGVTVGFDVGAGEESSAKARREGDGKDSGTGSGVVGDEEMQNLLDGFDRKMAVLRRIVASGEEYRRVKEGSGEPAQVPDAPPEV